MAGSQLKKLKAALKEHGLTGQANIKHKKTTKKAPSDSRRDEKEQVISKIREQFNPFEIKTNKRKFGADDKFQKGAQGKPGISKQIGEDARKAAWEAKKATKNRNGMIKDRRFGERDSTLTAEEKMLERFTRERQTQSKSKRGLYNLDSDDDDEDGGLLTHFGKSLTDDFAENDLNQESDSDDDFIKPKKRTLDEFETDEPELSEAGVPKKKTKAEVMQEVIAKSKFYKQQRQRLQEETSEKIMDLDDEFGDVMSELRSVKKTRAPAFAEASKDPNAINYEQSVRELNMERRAAPAERTKTDEEIRIERAKKMRELEEARERRMRGEEDTKEDRGADDLGDDFWEQDSADEGEGFSVEDKEQVDEEDSDSDEGSFGRPKKTKSVAIACPQSHDEFLDILENVPFEDTLKHTNTIIEAHLPRLQAGNKEKMAIFTVVVFQHILYLSESNLVNDPRFNEIQNGLVSIIKKLTEKYSNELTEALRDKIEEMHERIQDTVKGNDGFPRVSDLTCLAMIGLLYSTSDHYHLVVTPTTILMGEALQQLKYDSLNSLMAGVFISEVFLTYQRLSKRYIPEVAYFLQKALLALSPMELESEELSAKADERFPLPANIVASKETNLRLSDIDEDLNEAHKVQILEKTLEVLELALDTWKEKSALLEISHPFIIILQSYAEKFPDFAQISALALKFKRLLKFAEDERKPLTLQSHRKVAIATYTPQFEENFNPEKKSYDNDRQRSEINKMKALVKQERKISLREIRKDSRFEARQQIKDKKAAYDKYHSKMAKIMNTINTVEGAEKNEYEREKKQRKGKK